MIHLLELGEREFPDITKRVHYENDGHDYCKRRSVYVHHTDLSDDLGEYLHVEERAVIILHKFIQSNTLNWVFFHEIGHDLCHSPLSCKFTTDLRFKVEKEANIIAALLLIPTDVIAYLSDVEICSEFNYPKKLVEFRRKIFNEYKI